MASWENKYTVMEVTENLWIQTLFWYIQQYPSDLYCMGSYTDRACAYICMESLSWMEFWRRWSQFYYSGEISEGVVRWIERNEIRTIGGRKAFHCRFHWRFYCLGSNNNEFYIVSRKYRSTLSLRARNRFPLTIRTLHAMGAVWIKDKGICNVCACRDDATYVVVSYRKHVPTRAIDLV